MELTPEMIEQLKADLKTAKTYQDLMRENGAIKKIIKASLEGMLDAEFCFVVTLNFFFVPENMPYFFINL